MLTVLCALGGLLTAALPSAAQTVGHTSYANLWFEPEQVLDNEWFQGATWAHDTAQRWLEGLDDKSPWTVTDKKLLPASGNVHDYYSLSVYWWPNCSNVANTTELISDRCNYYQRDGEFNPDTYLVQDHKSYDDLTDAVYLAALAYAASGNGSHAAWINTVVKTWFLDEATYMTPHLNYSQVRRGPGAEAGAKSGVLDGKGLTKLVAAVEVLRKRQAPEWKAETDRALMDWARQMAEWLKTSEQGTGERAAANNHGTFFFNQICALYVLLDDYPSAVAELEWFYNTTFPGQIDANGNQPLESARTRPYHYLAYNLAALVTNAQLGDRVGLEPSGWNRTTASGATIFDALDYAIAQDPAASGEANAITEMSPSVAAIASKFGDPDGKYAAFLLRADKNYPAQPYYALASGVSDSEVKSPADLQSSSAGEEGNTNGARPLMPPLRFLAVGVLWTLI